MELNSFIFLLFTLEIGYMCVLTIIIRRDIKEISEKLLGDNKNDNTK